MIKINGFENYVVTKQGDIINTNTGRKIKKQLNNCGYHRVQVCKSKEKPRYFVHRLVAMAYLPNPNNLPQVNHVNGIKTDNRLENLEWCDASHNHKHAFKYLNRKVIKVFDLDNPSTKIPKKDIPKVKEMAKTKTYKQIATIYKCHPKYIGMIVRGECRNG